MPLRNAAAGRREATPHAAASYSLCCFRSSMKPLAAHRGSAAAPRARRRLLPSFFRVHKSGSKTVPVAVDPTAPNQKTDQAKKTLAPATAPSQPQIVTATETPSREENIAESAEGDGGRKPAETEPKLLRRYWSSSDAAAFPSPAGGTAGFQNRNVREPLHSNQIRNGRSREKPDPLFGMSIIIMALLIMVLWGKLCAVLCTCAWFFLIPRLHGQAAVGDGEIQNANLNSMDTDLRSEEQKRKVVLEGLLERRRRVPAEGIPRRE